MNYFVHENVPIYGIPHFIYELSFSDMQLSISQIPTDLYAFDEWLRFKRNFKVC